MIYILLFFTFFKIGLFTFGGGYAMIPLIQSEVTAREWATLEELVDFIAISESTPGPFAINIATYIGNQTGGLLGSVCATLGVVMPSFIVILLVAKFYNAFKNNKYVAGCLTGLRPVVIGLISYTVLSVAKTVFIPNAITSLTALFTPAFIVAAVIFAVMLVLLLWKKIHPIFIVIGSAAAGIAAGVLGII